MSTRIYLVTDVETNKHRLIRAGNQAQAILPVELAGGPATADMFEEATLVNAGGTD